MSAISKIIVQHRDWLVRSESRIGREFNYLKEDLADGSLNALDNVSDSLGRLATYYGIKGILAVNDGVHSDWNDISKSINYRYWALIIRARSFTKTAFLRGVKHVPNLTNHLGNTGCLLATFIVVDRDEIASQLADLLLGMLTIKGVVDSDCLKHRKLEPFMLWLYSVYSGKAFASEIEFVNLGVYQMVIEYWDKPDDLSLALIELCEYHLANTDDTGGSWDPEFKYAPFDLVPVEIQAIYVVREKCGLPVPSPNHPLLSLKTSSVKHLSISSDDLSFEVESAYKNFFG